MIVNVVQLSARKAHGRDGRACPAIARRSHATASPTISAGRIANDADF
jgi:hypothetical protein